MNNDSTIDFENSANQQKYSQILSDHHTNYPSQVSSRSSSSLPPHQSYKTRSFNKENYYNQRSALKGLNGVKTTNGWHRSNNVSTNYRFNAALNKDGKKSEIENNKLGDEKEPIKFNEGKI